MKKFTTFHFSMLAIAAGMLCASCSTDGNYDLDNIDSTARISVNNLTVPINIDPVKLETVLDISDDNQDIKKETLPDGTVQYCVNKEGTFHADGFSVPSSSFSDYTDVSTKNFPLKITSAGYAKSKNSITAATVFTATGEIPSVSLNVKFTSGKVDAAVQSIENIKVPTSLTLKLQINQLSNLLNGLDIYNLKIKCIPGLTVKNVTPSDVTYDSETGVLTFPQKIRLDNTLSYYLKMDITAIDCAASGMVFTNQVLSLDETVDIPTGSTVKFTNEDLQSGKTLADIPTNVSYTSESKMAGASVTSFTGEIAKSVEVKNPDPIDLSNLPEVLTQTGTSIELTKPRLTIDANNPMIQGGTPSGKAYSNLVAKTKVALTNDYDTYSSDEVSLNSAMNYIQLSPAAADLKEGYTLVGFEGLKEILTGDGISKKIYIKVDNPTVAKTKVTDFTLGDRFNAVDGKWNFYTPLTITDKSVIKYNKEWKDWADEDLQYLYIENGTLTVDISNNTPLAVESLDFTLYNEDRTQELKGEYKEGIPAKETKTVKIPLSGDLINDIDGAELNCHIKGGLTQGQEESLQPDQTLEVSNVKMTVNGFYEKKF